MVPNDIVYLLACCVGLSMWFTSFCSPTKLGQVPFHTIGTGPAVGDSSSLKNIDIVFCSGCAIQQKQTLFLISAKEHKFYLLLLGYALMVLQAWLILQPTSLKESAELYPPNRTPLVHSFQAGRVGPHENSLFRNKVRRRIYAFAQHWVISIC